MFIDNKFMKLYVKCKYFMFSDAKASKKQRKKLKKLLTMAVETLAENHEAIKTEISSNFDHYFNYCVR